MVVEVLAASQFVNESSSAVPGRNSQLVSSDGFAGLLFVGSPELERDFRSSVQRNVLEVSGGEAGKSLNRTSNKSSVLFSDQLESLQVIGGVSTESSASDSDSVDGQSFGVAVEVLSKRRGDLVGLVSEVVSLGSIEKSHVVRVFALFFAVAGIRSGDLVQNEFFGFVVVLSSISVRKCAVSVVVVVVDQFEVSAVELFRAVVESDHRLNHFFIVVENESRVLWVSESLDRRVHLNTDVFASSEVRNLKHHFVDDFVLSGFGSVFAEAQEFNAGVSVGEVKLLVNVSVGLFNQKYRRSYAWNDIAFSDGLAGRGL